MIVEDNKSRCTGCMACVQKCPFSAINVYLDDEGFYYPEVNKKLCHNCNACAKVCPISAKRTNDIESQSSPIAYACYSKDKFVREQSSSGGLFSLLAKRVLANGGMVVGAAFDKNFNVKHVCIYDDKDLFQLRGSKYVQSDVNNTFIVVREELESGRNVLFTGTMCQVAGLLHYLGKPYDNLLTIDILCHGVPSVKLWHKYLLQQEDEHNSKIKSISFRNKDLGWRSFSMKIAFLNGSTYSKIFRDDYYMSLYLSNICLRPSCYQCQFKNIVRASDISIGDCWAIDRSSELDNDKGTSVALIHSPKGKEAFLSITDDIVYQEDNVDTLLPPDADSRKSVYKHWNREKFFKNLDKRSLKWLSKLQYQSLRERIIEILVRVVNH